MTEINRDLFTQDPTATKIPNDGVAQVGRPETDQQWDVLQWELQNFVCSGQYARGIEQILDSFLTNLSQARQPAVWVSGFYGSGKSHLVRVLEYLWRNVELSSGVRARELVRLPDSVADQLTELSTAGKRAGGLWSAAGLLASGKSDAVRLAFLSVLFESAGLPGEYSLARFTIWAQQNGYLEIIRSAVEAHDRSFEKEIHNLYVSPIIAKALLEADSTLGDSVKDVRELLQNQFPPATKDISDEEMFSVMEDVLGIQSPKDGRLPLTLVVLDEMQQYIGDDNEKALAVQNIVEGVSSRFEAQVLFVATGQSALTATPTLQKLTDRFAVQVALSDRDVESVVREVVLRKRPQAIPGLKTALDEVSGEIDRHLGGTQLASKAADKADLVPDYPLLPTRRRFWELALRSIDRAGKAGVLRTQLRIVHEATAQVAGQPVGHVVGADFVYDEQAPGMLQSGVLLKEIDELIRGLRLQGDDGRLSSRICALIFLITQIPSRTVGGVTGLRATAPFLADLLVEDLGEDGAKLRKRVPELLNDLVEDGAVQRVDDEYLLQTEEGAEWAKDYRSRLAEMRDNAGRLNQLRSDRLQRAVTSELGSMKLTHGASKTPRTISQHWGEDEPSVDDGEVPVWFRDEWSVTDGAVRNTASKAGDESPIVFVFLPKREADQIKDALASYAAAEQTLQRPTPQTDEGKAAQQAMQTRLATEDARLEELFADLVAHARVFQGGGSELTITSLRDAVETAAQRSLIRMFPKFPAGDNPSWSKVIVKAREGAPDALEAVGHAGEPTTNPVCKEVLAAVSPGGTKGTELHKRFGAPGFGWPRDAVNGAILTLLAAGNIRATQEHKPLSGPKELPPNQIGKVTLYKEDEPPSVSQRLALKGLFTAAEVPYESGQEGAQVSALLQLLQDLASRAGGPPPLPEPPNTDHITALVALAGNQQFRAVADAHVLLREDHDRWRSINRKREAREAEWRQLTRLQKHAEHLPIARVNLPAIAAIRDGRLLLDDPDPVAPILEQLSTELRTEIMQRAKQFADAQRSAVEELENWTEWDKLDASEKEELMSDANLAPITPPDVRADLKLLEVLDATPLNAWEERTRLVPAQLEQLRIAALKRLRPEAVRIILEPVTIVRRDDMEAHFRDVRSRVQRELDAGKIVIL